MGHLEMGGDIMGYQNYFGYEREKNRGLSPSNNNNNNNNNTAESRFLEPPRETKIGSSLPEFRIIEGSRNRG